MIYEKYIYFYTLIKENKNILFNDNEVMYIDTCKLIRSSINDMHLLYRSLETRRKILQEFENKTYEICIRPYFCYDIKNLILEFICV